MRVSPLLKFCHQPSNLEIGVTVLEVPVQQREKHPQILVAQAMSPQPWAVLDWPKLEQTPHLATGVSRLVGGSWTNVMVTKMNVLPHVLQRPPDDVIEGIQQWLQAQSIRDL